MFGQGYEWLVGYIFYTVWKGKYAVCRWGVSGEYFVMVAGWGGWVDVHTTSTGYGGRNTLFEGLDASILPRVDGDKLGEIATMEPIVRYCDLGLIYPVLYIRNSTACPAGGQAMHIYTKDKYLQIADSL